MDAQRFDPPAPRQFAAGYRVAGRLRRGGESAIYQAVREADGREVVLKVFHVESHPTEQEAAPLLALPAHPNLVQVLAYGRTDDGLPFLALAYHPGDSYDERLVRVGPVSVDEAVRVGAAIADALAAVHGSGLVHGDVTPGNVLLAADGPLLTDFAIAATADEAAGTVALDRLTPHHAAPEVLLRQPADGRSDVYGLASTMWTLLAGYPPFAPPGGGRSIDPFEYREHTIHVPVPPVPRGDVPWWLQAVLQRAMAKAPGDRYPDAAAFGAALRTGGHTAAVVGEPVVVEPPRSVSAPASGAAVHGSVLPHPGPAAPPVPLPVPEPVPVPQPEVRQPPVDAAPAPAPANATPPPAPANATPPPAPVIDSPPPIRRRPKARSWVDVQPTGEAPARRVPPPAPAPLPLPFDSTVFAPEATRPPRRRGRGKLPWLVGSDVPLTGVPARQGTPPPVPAPAAPDPMLFTPELPQQPRERGRGKRVWMIGSFAVTAMFAAMLVAAVASQLSLRPDPPAEPPPATDPAVTAPAVAAPTNLEIIDERVAVALSWQDPTGGQVPFTIIGGPRDSDPNISVSVNPGQTSTRIQALNPQVEYCFRVLAVVSVDGDEVPASDEACTDRFDEGEQSD